MGPTLARRSHLTAAAARQRRRLGLWAMLAAVVLLGGSVVGFSPVVSWAAPLSSLPVESSPSVEPIPSVSSSSGSSGGASPAVSETPGASPGPSPSLEAGPLPEGVGVPGSIEWDADRDRALVLSAGLVVFLLGLLVASQIAAAHD